MSSQVGGGHMVGAVCVHGGWGLGMILIVCHLIIVSLYNSHIAIECLCLMYN